nr:endonuclease/exonuclease/phosphatase family protein [Acidimangrovimonas sediminis]
MRIATWDAALSRRGPGLLLQDIRRGKDPQIAAAVAVIAATRPDVLLITDIDYDATGLALTALRERLAAAGAPYPHAFARAPNTGVPTGLDLDGDGVATGPRDAQGYGWFPGQGGMAILSRLPIDAGSSRDLSALLWRDLPGNLIAGAGLGAETQAVQRLSSSGHWDVVVITPSGPLHLLAYAATPPVFDGPNDRNGRRNRDETALWLAYLDGRLPWPAPTGRFVILGDANLDPADGEGRRDALAALLADPRVQDPKPTSKGAVAAASTGHRGDPALTTADWDEGKGPGNLRVDYLLPSAGLRVTAAGVYWPPPGDPGADAASGASPHRLVWADIALP